MGNGENDYNCNKRLSQTALFQSKNGSFQNIPQLTLFGDRLTQGACPRL